MALLKRRTAAPPYANYQRYKPYLREDFAYVCVYCGIHENEAGGPRYFTVEHFRPKSRFPELRTAYHNLLYACGVCNSYKGNDWPSEQPLDDGVGYLDPCEHDYDIHFACADNCTVVGKTPVAHYMIKRMHLNRQMMLTIRRQRHEDEELHAQFVELFERNIAQLDVEARDPSLDPAAREALLRALARLRAQYQRRIEAWQRRWEPTIGLEDYR
jgi:hypothetical protein